MASWGTIMSMNLLVWKRPQFEAARVIKVRARGEKMSVGENGKMGGGKGVNGVGENGLRFRKGTLEEISHDERGKDIGKEEYQDQYIWQTFPEKGTFWERLGWALDLSCSFRGAGKIPRNIPHALRELTSTPRLELLHYINPTTSNPITHHPRLPRHHLSHPSQIHQRLYHPPHRNFPLNQPLPTPDTVLLPSRLSCCPNDERSILHPRPRHSPSSPGPCPNHITRSYSPLQRMPLSRWNMDRHQCSIQPQRSSPILFFQNILPISCGAVALRVYIWICVRDTRPRTGRVVGRMVASDIQTRVPWPICISPA